MTFGFIQASKVGFSPWYIQLSIAIGLILTIVFIYIENKIENPMMPLSLFKSPTFSAANLLTVFVYGSISLVLFFIPLNLIQVQGYPESIAGFCILPFGIAIALLSRPAGMLTDKYGPKPALIIGPLITSLAFFIFTRIPVTNGPEDFWWSFLPALLVGGIGMGFTVTPVTTAVMNSVTETDAGIGSGVNNTVSRLANVLSLAVVGSFALIHFRTELLDLLQQFNLTTDEMSYMSKQAPKLAEAKAPSDWSAIKQDHVKQVVNSSFLSSFRMVCYTSSILCFLGGVAALLFIKKNPEKANQNTA